MKKVFFGLILLTSVIVWMFQSAYTAEVKEEESFFKSSLHYTTRGMAYWYDRDNGGLEKLVGIPYSQLPCSHCHISSCDTCHKTKMDDKLAYSTEAARNQEICLQCHQREAIMQKIDRTANQPDVHLAKGLQCMNCHTAREVHGDGIKYDSMKQTGVFEPACNKCHPSVTPIISHKIHGEKLECKSCHVRHMVSCYNCHFDTLVKEGKKVAIPTSGWVFLMNYNGQITSANMQTFVVKGDKTFLMFAPANSHSIMKNGRQCNECHGTEIVKQLQDGKLSLTWLENNELKNLKGVIPVVDGTIYECVYQDYQNGKWIPLKNPAEPLLHYAGYGTPLTKEQLGKMAMPMGKR